VSEDSREYAGFWIRVLASLIDSVLMLLILLPPKTSRHSDGSHQC